MNLLKEDGKGYRYFAIFAVMALAFFWCWQKAGMFLDEIYSYGLSNSYFQPFLTTVKNGDIINTIFTKDELFNYLTVSGNDSFSYNSVFYNQMQDVHPPLFYVLLHTLSSIIPNTFTKWIGLGLNLLYFFITLLFIDKISRRLFSNRYIPGIMVMLYGCTSYALSNVIFIRMYMLSTMFSVILAWLILRIISENRWSLYVLSGLVVCAGLLTHYFFVFYAFFISVFLIIYLLCKKEYTRAVKAGIFLALGVVIFIIIFPTCLQHMTTRTGTGTTTAEYIASYSLSRVFWIAYELAYGYIFPVFVGILLLVFLIFNHKKTAAVIKTSNKSLPAIIIVVGPAIVAFFAITIASNSSRYIANIAPFFSFIVGYLIDIFVAEINSDKLKKCCLLLVTILPLLCSFKFYPSYLYSDYTKYDQMIEDCSDYACVYITTNSNPSITQDTPQLLHFDNVIVVDDDDSAFFNSNIEEIQKKEGLVVYFASYPESKFDEESVSDIAEKTGFTSSKFMYSNGWSDVYEFTEN